MSAQEKPDMPQVSAFFNGLRAVFGKEMVDAQIRKGDFYARENGHEFGTPQDVSRAVSVDQMVIESNRTEGEKPRGR